jgi:EpsI family protein
MISSLSLNTRFWALILILAGAGVVINLWQYSGEARVSRRPFSEFPTQLGHWKRLGADQRFDTATESVLRADDYISRNYYSDQGQVGSFYAGYYATQRNGATYHSPLNCLPGAGWTMSEPGEVLIEPANGRPAFVANRYVIQNGGERQLMIYWYQGRGRAVANEYWGKIYTVVDSIKRRRSDGALVRVVVPVADSEPPALRTAAELAAEASAVISTYVPD